MSRPRDHQANGHWVDGLTVDLMTGLVEVREGLTRDRLLLAGFGVIYQF